MSGGLDIKALSLLHASRQTPDAFAEGDTPERRTFLDALNALAKVTVRRYPGAGSRPDAERRDDERAIVDACAEVCRAAEFPGFTLEDVERWVRATGKPDWRVEALSTARAERDAAIAHREQARSERDAAEKDRAALREVAAERLEQIERLEGEVAAWLRSREDGAIGERDAVCPDDATDAAAELNQARADVAALRSRVADAAAEIVVWRDATGCAAPEEAKRMADEAATLRSRLSSATSDAEWRKATGCVSPQDVAEGERVRERRTRADIARIVELETDVRSLRLMAASGLRLADEPDSLAAVRRDFTAEIQRRDERIEALERWLSTAAECRARITRRLTEIERRTAPKPDALSEECIRLQEEQERAGNAWDPIGGRPIAPDPVAAIRDLATPAEPHPVEVWEDSDDGERLLVVYPRAALRDETPALCDARGVAVECHVCHRSNGHAEQCPRGWVEANPEEAAERQRVREEVAALCDAAEWWTDAADLRAGRDAAAVLRERRGVAEYPANLAEETALNGLERLVRGDVKRRSAGT